MGEHCPFRHAGSATGVLQESQIGTDNVGFNVLHAITGMQRAAERDRIGEVILRHQTLDVLHHEIHQGAFRCRELIAHPGQDHMFNLSFLDHFLQGMGKVGDDHNRRRSAVIQLMLKLARRIQRIDVHHNHPRAQNTEERDGVLQQVRHHQRDAIALLQPQSLLKISGERPAALLQLTVGHHLAHVDKRRLVGVARGGMFK